ncbi:MAG: CBS domain-containing protein [Chloroflexota bacterium]
MLKLRDVMRRGFLVTLPPNAAVSDAVSAMVDRNVGIVAVIENRTLVGVFSERDLARRVVYRGLDAAATRLSEVMTKALVTADAGEDFRTAVQKMDRANIRHLPVFEDGELASMVSIRDLLRVELQEAGADLRLLRDYITSGQEPALVT